MKSDVGISGTPCMGFTELITCESHFRFDSLLSGTKRTYVHRLQASLQLFDSFFFKLYLIKHDAMKTYGGVEV
jgi:hypothetical protein